MPVHANARAITTRVQRLTSAGVGAQIGDFGVGDAVRLVRARRRGAVVVTLDLTGPLRQEGGGLAALRARGKPTLRQIVDALRWAADDPRVVSVLARVGGGVGGLAVVQEVATAVRQLTAAGTPTVAHTEAFGETGNGTLSYLLASAFGEVHLGPSGELGLFGVAGEVVFLRGALDKAGVEPQFARRHEYKNAPDVFTEHGFTAAHREALESLVEDWADQVVEAIAAARGLDVTMVRAAMDDAPLTPFEARERGLVDRLAYLDESLEAVRALAPGDATLTPLTEYHAVASARRRWHERRAPVVAVVDATGPITVRRPERALSAGVASDRLCGVLRAAVADDDIAAIVLHVDSTGGSAVASDAIRREVRRARGAGTPVVAWMGDVAGSGGYYIAMAADRIIAQPGTLTGSIGVIGGKAVRTGLEQKLGLRTEAVTRGAHARFFSSAIGFSDSERARLDLQLDRIYDDFTRKVAQDRALPKSHVEQVARGRVWTGAQARAHGLVDRLGGYHTALQATRGVLGLPDDAPLRVHRYPPRPTLMARIRGAGPADPAERDVLAARRSLPPDLAAWIDLAQAAIRPQGALAMPWVPRPG